MTENNAALITSYRHFLKNKHYENAIALIADKAIWESDNAGGSWSGKHKGKAEILNHFKCITQETQLISWESKSIFPYCKNTVVETAYLKFKFLKTGEIYESDAVCLYEIENEQIVHYKIYEDEQKLINCYQRVLLKQ